MPPHRIASHRIASQGSAALEMALAAEFRSRGGGGGGGRNPNRAMEHLMSIKRRS
jgi:hypothetical protein